MLILGCRIPVLGSKKTTMGIQKTTIGEDNILAFEKAEKKNNVEGTVLKEPPFQKAFYHWVMFIISYYTRVRENLKMDFESFVIIQVVVSHSVYQINKTENKTFSELEEIISNITQKNFVHKTKLTFASIAEVLKLPRETVRRKILSLVKKNILLSSNSEGIKLGPAYKSIYKEFITKTTLDLSSMIKKWEKSGALQNLKEL
tara:strand:- start:252 stop:857 length:606 start_codon:yes stop_codon:yes gene_type:complete